LQASFPHDVEIISSKNQPPCASHTFVIQQDSTQTLYGVCLRVWSRADDKRKDTITELRKRSEPGFHSMDTEEYWIPYAYNLPNVYSIDRQSVLPLALSSLQPFVRLSQGHVDRITPQSDQLTCDNSTGTNPPISSMPRKFLGFWRSLRPASTTLSESI
jgi:hypothetical protein